MRLAAGLDETLVCRSRERLRSVPITGGKHRSQDSSSALQRSASTVVGLQHPPYMVHPIFAIIRSLLLVWPLTVPRTRCWFLGVAADEAA